MKNFAWILIGIVAARAGVLLLLPEPGPKTPATSQIEAAWKNGRPVDTARSGANAISETASVQDEGPVDLLAAPDRWTAAADSFMGGQSTAVQAWETTGAAQITGRVADGYMFPYAGAMWFASATPMQPVDHAEHTRLQIKLQGDAAEYQVMFFSGETQSAQPARIPIPPGRVVTIELGSVDGLDPQRLRAIGVFAGGEPRKIDFKVITARLE